MTVGRAARRPPGAPAPADARRRPGVPAAGASARSARKPGSTLACNPDAERLLPAGELVGVWPEGFKGIGKPFADRYKLQRFGRGGFVSAALRTGVPIIPCSIVGAEEIYPKIGDVQAAGPAARPAVLPGDADVPAARAARRRAAAVEVAHRVRRADRDRRSCGPDAADDPMLVFNLDRPGARDDPADPLPAARPPPQRLPRLSVVDGQRVARLARISGALLHVRRPCCTGTRARTVEPRRHCSQRRRPAATAPATAPARAAPAPRCGRPCGRCGSRGSASRGRGRCRAGRASGLTATAVPDRRQHRHVVHRVRVGRAAAQVEALAWRPARAPRAPSPGRAAARRPAGRCSAPSTLSATVPSAPVRPSRRAMISASSTGVAVTSQTRWPASRCIWASARVPAQIRSAISSS